MTAEAQAETDIAATLSNTMDELNALKDFFNSAESKLDKGYVIDLTGMDTRIAALCQVVQKADPTHQQIFLPELSALIDLLNMYEQSLRRAHASEEQKDINKTSND